MRRGSTRQKVALFGNFGTGNLGNEATLQAMIFNLRGHLPSAEICCICPNPESTASQYSINAFPIRAPFAGGRLLGMSLKGPKPSRGSNSSALGMGEEPNRTFKAFARFSARLRFCAYPLFEVYRWSRGIGQLRDSDLLVMTGTGMLGDYAITPFGLHYDIFRWAVIAKLCRCKLLFVSVGGGPIHHPLSRFFVKVALRVADYRSYRDASSKDALEAIGVNVKNDAVYPDLAYSLPRALVPEVHEPRRHGDVIGVGVMNYHNRRGRSGDDAAIYRDYVGRLASFVVCLLERGYTVRVLIGDFVWDQGVRQDLRRALEERRVRYHDGNIIDEPASSVNELLAQLSSVDVVVSSRFHNLLLALMLAKPVVAISYHEKFQPLLTGVGLAAYCHDIEHIDVDVLIGDVLRLREDTSAIQPKIRRETESYRRALDEQYERILQVSGLAAKRSKIAAAARLTVPSS
jgi:polysaccharide pyruvyl transferase WcaK-like protein